MIRLPKIATLGLAICAAIGILPATVGAEGEPPPSFRLAVMPILTKAGCNRGACHGSLSGKGGFKLSLRGDDPAYDLLRITRDQFGRRVNRTSPADSLVLWKATSLVPHEGGRRFARQSAEYATLLRWIAAGAVDDMATAPRVARLRVEPDSAWIEPKQRTQALRVTAELSDGTLRDVTPQASYEASEPVGVLISHDGVVSVDRRIETAIGIRFANARTTSRLVFLADRPSFTWNGPEPANFIDELQFARLRRLRVNPSPLATDSVFLRRAYLTALGVLPTPAETRAFLIDRDLRKRDLLIDRIVNERREFAEFWAMKWADVLRNEEKAMGRKGVWSFYRWLVRRLDRDVPLDALARDIVAASGSTWLDPPSSFYRTNREPTVCAETLGQVFLGVRLQCAKCHNHPFDVWTQNDYYGLAAYFAGLDRKQLNNRRRDGLDSHEVNGDEVVFYSAAARLRQPTSGEMMMPRPLGGPNVEIADPSKSLADLADRVVRDPQFARNMANRIWFHLLGRGLVDPPDDFRESNPPSNPELLEALARNLIAGGMRLRPLVATIMKSATFQLDAAPNETNAADEANFAKACITLLPAEVLLDALSQTFEKPEPFEGAPPGTRAVQLPGVRMTGKFAAVFGKPERLLACDCERSRDTSLNQALEMINGEAVRRKLEAPDNRIGRLLREGRLDSSIHEELTLAALCRLPTADERAAAASHSARATDRRAALEDIAWSIVNSKEFLLRR